MRRQAVCVRRQAAVSTAACPRGVGGGSATMPFRPACMHVVADWVWPASINPSCPLLPACMHVVAWTSCTTLPPSPRLHACSGVDQLHHPAPFSPHACMLWQSVTWTSCTTLSRPQSSLPTPFVSAICTGVVCVTTSCQHPASWGCSYTPLSARPRDMLCTVFRSNIFRLCLSR